MQNFSDSIESLELTFAMALSLATLMSEHFRKVAVEMADISFDEFDRGTELVGELVEARTLERVVEVETDYLASAHRAFSRHSSRLGDLYAAIGEDLAKPIAGAHLAAFA